MIRVLALGDGAWALLFNNDMITIELKDEELRELYSKLHYRFRLADVVIPTETIDRSVFRDDLRKIINKHSMEKNSNTADYILADYLINCLTAFNFATADRDKLKGE